jgi:hypothetical protein
MILIRASSVVLSMVLTKFNGSPFLIKASISGHTLDSSFLVSCQQETNDEALTLRYQLIYVRFAFSNNPIQCRTSAKSGTSIIRNVLHPYTKANFLRNHNRYVGRMRHLETERHSVETEPNSINDPQTRGSEF